MKEARMRWIAVVALVLAAAGCNTVALVDDVDLDLDFLPLVGPSDDLHTPYVQGSSMTVYVQTTQNIDKTQWTVASSDPSVFSISNVSHYNDDHNHTQLSVSGNALVEGSVDLIVLDGDQREVHRRRVEVKLPDRVELRAHGLLLIDRPDSEADVDEARIQQGGTATYLARYWKGSQVLYGNGALSTMSPVTSLAAHVEQTFLFEDRDWLQITTSATGTEQLGLLVSGVHVADLTVVTVPSSDIADVRVRGESETTTHKGNWLVALAEAADGQNRTVYGVEYSWKLDSAAQLGLGDLYRYSYDAKKPHVLTATFNGLSATAQIHGYGFVDSTNHLGCSYGGPAGKPAAALLLIGVALLALARRRARG
jgi:MYXO-CTERM domain-containing protein